MSSPESSGGVPRRVVLLIVLGGLIPFVGVGILLATRLGGDEAPSFESVDDYLAAPEAVPARVEVVSDQVRRIKVSAREIEVYDLGGERYTISPSGTNLHRGGAVPVSTESFAVSAVDFSKLPGVLAAAAERGGAAPEYAVVEKVGGELVWRVDVRTEHGYQALEFSSAGVLRE